MTGHDLKVMIWRLMIVVILAVAAIAFSVAKSEAAHASTVPVGVRALRWAEAHEAGCWYSWGGTSCTPGYDCSGAVMTAFAHVGVSLPRTTYEMLASPKLRRVPVASAPRGALMFFSGGAHVEIKTKFWHGTFGAQESGTRVGWHTWGGSWVPDMAFVVG